MNELALFAGAGGGILGGKLLGWRTVCAVEIEAYPREVLLRRQRDGLLPVFPIWDDARTFDGRPWRGLVDVVAAGFPCQPFSTAGKQRGADDPRNGWPWTARILGEVRPRFAFLENVPNLLTHEYFGHVLGDLAALGYDAIWDCISAGSIGAPHRRDRLWILAYAQSERGLRLPVQQRRSRQAPTDPTWCGAEVADAERGRLQGGDEQCAESPAVVAAPCVGARGRGEVGRSWWPEPGLGRMAHGVADGMERLGALGNGQVPAVVRRAWEVLMGCSVNGGSRVGLGTEEQ